MDPGSLVCEHGDWLAWVPPAATWPYELRPGTPHRGAGPGRPDGCDRDGLAAALVDALARLDQLFDGPMPYMLWIHQRPTDGGRLARGPGARPHHAAVPGARVQRYVAAAEQGGGVYFNPVPPEDAAARLRGLPGA